MYYLLVYNDYNHESLIFVGSFIFIKDITKFTNGLIRYCDRREKLNCYKTYKSLFKIVKYDLKRY